MANETRNFGERYNQDAQRPFGERYNGGENEPFESRYNKPDTLTAPEAASGGGQVAEGLTSEGGSPEGEQQPQ